jgi:hypothetical protein
MKINGKSEEREREGRGEEEGQALCGQSGNGAEDKGKKAPMEKCTKIMVRNETASK